MSYKANAKLKEYLELEKIASMSHREINDLLNFMQTEIERLKGIKPGFTDKTEQRYGIRWNGPESPLCVSMDDGYWTPWHLAQAEIEKLKAEVYEYRFNLNEAKRICKEVCWRLGHEADAPSFCDMQGIVESVIRGDAE